MTKWDYRVFDSRTSKLEVERVLKQLGQEGWELVSVEGAFHYFKRPIP